MKIEKEINITIDVDLKDTDIFEWMEQRIDSVDILYTEEAKEKMKAIKSRYYEKWIELYWFFQYPGLELSGKDPVPSQVREECKVWFH